jgi:hypothetical protein
MPPASLPAFAAISPEHREHGDDPSAARAETAEPTRDHSSSIPK